MRRRPAWVVAAAAMIAGAVLTAPSASAQTGPPAGIVLEGQIDGEDGRAVNAMLGFDFVDAAGRHLRRDGCAQGPECPFVGYASVVRVNPKLTAQGSADRTGRDTSYSVPAPAGTTRVFVEVYPQNERLRTDEARYGHAMRHSVEVPLTESLDFRLPLTDCGQGGTVGSIFGNAVRDGEPLPLKRVVTWSNGIYSRQDLPTIGWNVGTASADASFRVPHLPPGQRYNVWLTAVDGSTYRELDVPVETCTGTGVEVSFPPADQVVAGDAPATPTVLGEPQLPGQEVALNGISAPGVPVQLWVAAPGGIFRALRSTVASESGDYLFIVRPIAATQLRVRIGGQDSPPATVQIRSAVTFGAVRTGLRTYRMSGRVTPAQAGKTVEIRHVTATGERVLAIPTTLADGTFTMSRRFLGSGPVSLVARSVGDAVSAAGRSPVIRPVVR